MMNEITMFDNTQFGNIRTMVDGDNIWFVAKDIATALGFSNPSKAIKDLVDAEDKLNNRKLSSLGQRGGWLINESGMYDMVSNSKLPSARLFRKWITHDVLPVIRKTGGYINEETKFVDSYFPNATQQQKDIILLQLEETRKNRDLIEQQKVLLEERDAKIALLTPKASYTDLVLACKDLVPITIIAKDFGMSANAMNSKLNLMKVQYKSGKTWVLFRKYQDAGYAQTSTYVYYDKRGIPHASQMLKWTQKGRLMIYQELKKEGILPVMEKEMKEAA